MSLTGHQTVYGLHYNTENYHVHIAVNRMNPETLKVVRPHNGFDIEEAHKILALIEKKQGWSSEKNARYAVNDDGEIVPRPKPENAPKPKPAALDFESATGEKSAQRIAQERGHAVISNAQSWPELHRKLAGIGLRFEKKGSGALIVVGDTAVKASSVDRAFSMKNLCKKLGEFVPGDYAPEPEKIAPEPVASVNLEEWKTYCAERAEARKPDPFPLVSPAVTAMQIRHGKERIDILGRLARHGFSVLNIARHCLKLRQREELRRLRQERKDPRRGVARFETWLRARGLHRQADLWRYRNRVVPKVSMPPLEPSFPPTNMPAPENLFAAYSAHRAAVIKENAGQDASRIDALVALRMRSDGHSQESVVEAIRQAAPEAHVQDRDRQRYAERAAAYAFGIAGDMARAEHKVTLQETARLEQLEQARVRMR
jgi:hypothetical protein